MKIVESLNHIELKLKVKNIFTYTKPSIYMFDTNLKWILQEFMSGARGHGFTRKKLRDRKSNDRATFFPLMNACRGGDLIGSQWDSKYHKNHIIYEKTRYLKGC